MWTVVHRVNKVDGNQRTYWHHVMQLTVMIAERIFAVEANTSSVREILFVTNNTSGLRWLVDRHEWVNALGLPVRYSTRQEGEGHQLSTLRTCDPLGPSAHNEQYCAMVHRKLKARLVANMELKEGAQDRMLLIVREPWMEERTRRIDNLDEVIKLSAASGITNRVSVTITTLHRMKLIDQLQLFYTSKHIVIQRGSATANLLLAPVGCNVVLLSSQDQWRPGYWIPTQYNIHFGVVHGRNFDPTVRADTASLRAALDASGLKLAPTAHSTAAPGLKLATTAHSWWPPWWRL